MGNKALYIHHIASGETFLDGTSFLMRVEIARMNN